MVNSSMLALIYNVSLLLSMALIFDALTVGRRPRYPWLERVLTGVVLGAIGMAVMVTPWVYAPGVIFDTRTVLLGVAGLYFGAVPTLIAMAMTAALRWSQGGAAALTGILTIVLAGGIGLIWRYYRSARLADLRLRELYLMGVCIHIGMLLAMLTLPGELARSVLEAITAPVLLIYPLATALLGGLMTNRLRRDRIDQALSASEARLRSIVDNLPVAIAIKEGQRFTYLNRTFVTIFGYDMTTMPLVEDWWTKAYPDPAYRQRMQDAWAAARGMPNADNVDLKVTNCRVRCGDGSERIIDVGMVMLDGLDLVLFLDMTDTRRTEAQLRRQATLLDRARDAIVVRDLEHRVLYANRSAEKLLGWSADELIGQPTPSMLYRDSTAFLAAFERVMSNGEWEGELTLVARDGRDVLVDTSWTLMRDDEGAPQAILAINSDITESKKIETQFLRAQRMESLGTLAGGIAHDLNNALAPILLGIGMLKRQEHSPAETRLLDTMERSAQQGAALVRQVLTFARGVEGPRTKVAVADVLAEAAQFVRNTFPRNIEFGVEVADDLYPILGDATQIQQVLINLAVNARDAMPEGGRLSISAVNTWLDETAVRASPHAQPGPYVLMTVADTGTGIPVAIRERVFDPFFSTKETGKGTGLGLSTALAVVKSHRGVLNLYTEEGEGTVFKIYLPALTEGPDPASLPEPARFPRGQGELVLVVDDEPAVREVTRDILESFGYHTISAAHGADALSIYTQRGAEIALVLTDMMMPVMDGHALIQALYQINPAVKIIAASGLAANGMVAKAASAGVQHFLPKPYSTESLLAICDQVLHTESPA